MTTILTVYNRKNPRHTTRSQKVTQCWYKTLLWVPCKFCQWSGGKELLDETTIKYTEIRALTAIQTGCLGALHGSQSLTELNRWGMLVFNEEYYLGFHHFHTFCCVPKHIRVNEGILFAPCSILIAISKVLMEIHQWEHVWNVLICILGN